MADKFILIQTRIPSKQAKKLDKAQREAGFVTRAQYLRQIIADHLEDLEVKERN